MFQFLRKKINDDDARLPYQLNTNKIKLCYCDCLDSPVFKICNLFETTGNLWLLLGNVHYDMLNTT